MNQQLFSLIGNYGAVGLLFAWFIYQYFKERGKADTLKNANQDRKTDTDEVAKDLSNSHLIDISNLKTVLELHIKGNEEAFSVVHNGLNTMNNRITDYNNKLENLNVTVAKLSTIIEERIPRK